MSDAVVHQPRVTRLAPSPTGALHLGNARTFLVNWLIARQNGWRIILRIEDIDGPRIKRGADVAAIEDLRWLGLDWDDGPNYQSARLAHYRQGLNSLLSSRKAYPCVCTRKEVDAAASAPHAEDGAAVYPGTCRDRFSSLAAAAADGRAPAIRFDTRGASVQFDDCFSGHHRYDVEHQLGDFVIAKGDGTPAYQLAVVIDDADMGVTDVLRGDDLIDSTPRQILLYRALGLDDRIPTYSHLPLIIGPDGRRLAKRHGDSRLATYRAQGVSAGRILMLLAQWSGIEDAKKIATAGDLLGHFDLGACRAMPSFSIPLPQTCRIATLMNVVRAMNVMSGRDRDIAAVALRAALTLVEPFYAGAMRVRNTFYSCGILKQHRLPRPTISIGNLTTGGTGKTPVVRWLAEQFIARGLRPAVLLRGYRGDGAGSSDEQHLFTDALGERATVVANPNRREGAAQATRSTPPPDVFLLDDAFQHRRVARDFDLVLIDATEPFGFNHVLPRGLLREPVSGLRRADAVVITRSNQVSAEQLQTIEQRVQRYALQRSIFFASHMHAGLIAADGTSLPLEELAHNAFFAFAAIANPGALQKQLEKLGRCAGFEIFDDHHAYTSEDLDQVRQRANAASATRLVTTEKDWVKLRALPNVNNGIPILRLDLKITFRGDDEEQLLNQIMAKIQSRLTAQASPAPLRA